MAGVDALWLRYDNRAHRDQRMAYADYQVLAQVAEVLGESKDCGKYRKWAEKLATAMNDELTKSSGVYVDGLSGSGKQSAHVSQHANMMPLALGMVPEENQAAVLDEVKKQKISVGMVTMPWLIRAIGESGAGEHLVELFTNEEWDGWAQCLAKGATSTWESWMPTVRNRVFHMRGEPRGWRHMCATSWGFARSNRSMKRC